MFQKFDSFYPTVSGVVVLLSDSPADMDFASWYLTFHAPRISSLKAVDCYTATLVSADPAFKEALSQTGGTLGCPWNIRGVDFLGGCRWEDVAEAYANCNLCGAYRTTEYIIRELHTQRPVGIKSPEPLRIGFLLRPEGISHQQAMLHWIEQHPSLALLHHTGLAAYTQDHVEEKLLPQGPEIDGINRLLYWNLEAVRYGHFSRSDSQQVILEDCAHFRSVTYTLPCDQYVMKKDEGV